MWEERKIWWQRPELSPHLMRWICSFLCQIGNWEQNATLSKQLLGGVCWRPEPLLRVQLHSIPIHPETHAGMREIKIGPHVGFNKEQPDKSSTDAADLPLGLWAFHGNVNFPLTLTGHSLAVNNSPIESGQCPLAASGPGGPMMAFTPQSPLLSGHYPFSSLAPESLRAET